MLKRVVGQLPLVLSVALVSTIMVYAYGRYTGLFRSCDVTCPAGLSGYEIVTDGPHTVTGGRSNAVACPAGKKVIGGGVSTNPEGLTIVENSYPYVGGNGTHYWKLGIIPVPGYAVGPFDATFYAICVSVP